MIRIALIGLLASCAGCATSSVYVARTQFAADYSCDRQGVVVDPAEDDQQSDTHVDHGCGANAEYVCIHPQVEVDAALVTFACSLRPRVGIEATDGSLAEEWQGNGHSAERQAALASAAHDLPCDRSALQLVGDNIVDGCGQRVTYQLVSQSLATPPGHFRITVCRRETLIGRIAVATSPGAK